MPEGKGEQSSVEEKLRTEAPVNGGRNYNGPKVAKFLVGQVPTRMNGVTILGAVSTRDSVKFMFR